VGGDKKGAYSELHFEQTSEEEEGRDDLYKLQGPGKQDYNFYTTSNRLPAVLNSNPHLYSNPQPHLHLNHYFFFHLVILLRNGTASKPLPLELSHTPLLPDSHYPLHEKLASNIMGGNTPITVVEVCVPVLKKSSTVPGQGRTKKTYEQCMVEYATCYK
jgi:hypothetical protein